MRVINEIILHCTDTRTNATVEAIRNYHIKQNGWLDIGYHYLLDVNGKWHVGRNIEQIGAHCKGHNNGTIGIAYIGKTPTDNEVIQLAHVCNFLIACYGIKKISRHCIYANKTCPNFTQAHIDLFNSVCNLPLH